VIDEHSTRTVLAGDVDLHVDDGGARFGAPVVIALGAGGRVAQLSAVLEHLRQQRRVITYDPRGHGQSSLAHDYSIEAQVRDLTTILDSLHLDHVVLAGVGSGGIAAAEAARRQPQRVIGVALLGPAGDYLLEDAPRANVVDSIRRVMSSSGSPPALSRFFLPADSLILGWVIRDLRSTPLDAVLGVLDASARYDFAPAMEEYHGPRMILLPSGSAGPLRPPLAAARDSIVRETYASGRWLYLTAAAEVSRRLEAFVYAAEWMHRQ
jgi:pimeloyl-ACP methyl ester carboxylesterase